MKGPVRGVLVAVVAGLVVALVAEVAWLRLRWHAQFDAARFLDHREKVSGDAAAVTVVGYVVATVRSDVDFFGLAHADGAHPRVQAALCDSGTMVEAWSAPMPQASQAGPQPFRYDVLLPLRAGRADLASTTEDVCLHFVATTPSPFTWVPSAAVVVPLGGDLRRALAAYARRDGPVQLMLDPGCMPTLCQPDFSPDDLRR